MTMCFICFTQQPMSFYPVTGLDSPVETRDVRTGAWGLGRQAREFRPRLGWPPRSWQGLLRPPR